MGRIAETVQADQMLGGFLKLLLEKNRAAILPDIADEMRILADRAQNITGRGCGAVGDPPVSGSLGLLDDLDQPPVLGGAERTGLHDLDEVAGAGLVALVVDLDLLGTAEDLAVQGVRVALSIL